MLEMSLSPVSVAIPIAMEEIGLTAIHRTDALGDGNRNSCSSKIRRLCASVCTVRYRVMLFILFLSGFVLGWTGIASYAATQYSTKGLDEICPATQMWNYLLVLIFVNVITWFAYVFSLYNRYFNGWRFSMTNVHIIIGIQVIVGAWGLYILAMKCVSTNLVATLIYRVIYVWVIWQLVVFVLLILFSIILCLCVF